MNQTMVELRKISSLWTTTPQVMTSIVEVETVGKTSLQMDVQKECK